MTVILLAKASVWCWNFDFHCLTELVLFLVYQGCHITNHEANQNDHAHKNNQIIHCFMLEIDETNFTLLPLLPDL